MIKSLEEVVIGIAKFENKIDEYIAAGGVRPSDADMESDLNAILPAKVSELLCFKLSDPKMSYESFKSFVEGQTAQILMNSGRLPVHALDEGDQEDAGYDATDEWNGYDQDQDLVAWVGRMLTGKGKGKGKG